MKAFKNHSKVGLKRKGKVEEENKESFSIDTMEKLKGRLN